MAKQLTLKNIESFTIQQVFDKIAKHLLKQKRRAQSGNLSCLYRTKDNDTGKELKCAIGCLIPLRDYKPSMEGQGVGSLILVYSKTFPYEYISSNHKLLSMLEELQKIHDKKQVETWDSELQQLAKNYYLEWNVY